MFKHLFNFTLALIGLFFIVNVANAADVYQKITVEGRNYRDPGNIEFSPRTIHVNKGDTLHLTIQAPRSTNARIFMPTYNMDQQIAKTDAGKIDLCMANPVNEVMYFQIGAMDGRKVPGYIVTDNYKEPSVPTSKIVDTSPLNPIINYSKDYCYDEKKTPRYSTGNSVRGYW